MTLTPTRVANEHGFQSNLTGITLEGDTPCVELTYDDGERVEVPVASFLAHWHAAGPTTQQWIDGQMAAFVEASKG